MKLRLFDLNLLVLLDVLIEERSVRRTSERVGLSQSATSHALDRLRKLLGDDLLVRTAAGMEPTARALSLAGPLHLALQGLESALAPPCFDPSVAEDEFTIATQTHETIVVLPSLVDQLRGEAPGVRLTVRSGAANDILDEIDAGRVDIGIGRFDGLADRYMTRRLIADSHVCTMRADHPLAGAPLSLQTYLAAPHLLINQGNALEDAVDASLAAMDRKRRIMMRLPHGFAAVIALVRSDMIATVTRGAARMFADGAPIVSRDLPFDVPVAEYRFVWNQCRNESPSHSWLRRKLATAGAFVEAAAADAARETAPVDHLCKKV